jgi:hypothetical protein
VGDSYPPGPLEGYKASRVASGQLPRKAFPSWARLELLVEWAEKEADSGPGSPSDSCAMRSNSLTFPLMAPLNIPVD